MNYPPTHDLELRFQYHPPTSDRIRGLHNVVRQRCMEIAQFLDIILPECRERSLAISHLEEAMMWGNAAIARRLSAQGVE